MDIEDLVEEVRRINDEKGWHDKEVTVAMMVANLHGEGSELWEAYRAGRLNEECDKADKMRAAGTPVLTCAEEELADIIIRTLDDAYLLGVDIVKALKGKCAFNATRPHRHGGKLA